MGKLFLLEAYLVSRTPISKLLIDGDFHILKEGEKRFVVSRLRQISDERLNNFQEWASQ